MTNRMIIENICLFECQQNKVIVAIVCLKVIMSNAYL